MGVVEDAGKIAGALRAKADVVKTDTANATRPAAPDPKPVHVKDTGRRYGDPAGAKKGEQRINVDDYLKPLGGSKPISYKHGTDYVPKTGLYKLEEGEAVKTKDENKMDSNAAMAKITGKKGVPEKKIHKITTHKSDDGKLIHTHIHHHPGHHPDETHVSNNIGDAQAHMAAQEPNMSAQAPAMPEAGAPPAMPGM